MVTARDEEIDRVVGFEVGAEDYVVKPYSVRELILHLCPAPTHITSARHRASGSVLRAFH